MGENMRAGFGRFQGIGDLRWASARAGRLLAAVGLAAAAALGFPAAASAQGDQPAYEPGELIVVCEQQAGPGQVSGSVSAMARSAASVLQLADTLQAHDATRVEIVGPSVGDDGEVLKVQAEGDLDALAAELESMPGVAYAQRNFRYYLMEPAEEAASSPGGFAAGSMEGASAAQAAQAATDDPSIGRQYYLNAWDGSSSFGAGVIDAWETSKAAGCVTVAVLDTGILATHEDLSENIDKDNMKDVYNGTAAGVISDYVGHGTHVAGIAAGVANNGKGIAGASYNANILPIKVFNNETGDNAYTDSAYLLKAYQYLQGLVASGEVDDLHVVNMSLGGYAALDSTDVLLEQAIATMRDSYDVLTVCSGGNGDDYGRAYGPAMSCYPSDFDEVMSVTALTAKGENTAWSDYNLAKDISAPGTDLYSTYRTSTSSYTEMSGTSMAAPLVSGIAALLWAYNPDLTVDQAFDAIRATAHELDSSGSNYHSPTYTGSAGAIDAAAALGYVAERYPSSAVVPSLSKAEVTLDVPGGYVFYTGEAFTPKVKVVLDGKTLVEGSDYKVAYTDNVEVGTARVTVEALGVTCRGKRTVTFSICKDLAAAGELSVWSISDRSYTGKAITPSLQVYYGSEKLVKGIDYTASFENNVYGPVATVSLKGMGDYRGAAQVTFNIVGCPLDAKTLQTAISKAQALLDSTTVSDKALAADKKWVTTATAKTLERAIAQAKEPLAALRQTQAAFDAATSKLNAAVTAFKTDVRPYSIAKATVKLAAASYVYNGNVRKPAVSSVTLNAAKLPTSAYKVTYSATSPKAVGSYTVTVKGQGNYTGTVTASYKITKAANPIAVKAKTTSAKRLTAKSGKKTTFALAKYATVTDKSNGTRTYARTSGNSKIAVAKKTGVITVPKTLKRGTYTLKVKVSSAATKNYKAGSKAVTVYLKLT